MTKRFFAPVTLLIAAFVLALGVAASLSAASAQGTATPAGQEDVDPVAPYPAHIHSGTCEELGDVVFPLSDLTRIGADVPPGGTPVEGVPTVAVDLDATPVPGAVDETTIVSGSTTIVEASLDDILAEEHAINVHQSPENIDVYIACGDLTGTPTDGELQIELQELNESGYVGEAQLQDNEDGTTTVTVVLMLGAEDGTGTPEASPAG
ncbi:MAG TPA: hypothetical protein VGR29_08280 [Thermomicrobiales bacterium]|nr:hypothetical protein [Thermomicrobiales bacterium]